MRFFRETKPLFYSRYIYFISVYNFEMLRPIGSNEVFKDYIKREQADISRFFAHNQQFYQYYRSGNRAGLLHADNFVHQGRSKL